MNKRGFTIFFAILVASLALAVGFSIYDLLIRELQLSEAGTQSQYAIYAADTGAECALYWDAKYINAGTNNNGGSNGAFATSSVDTLAPGAGSGILCNSIDISSNANNSLIIGNGGSNNWNIIYDPVTPTVAATTTFYISLGTAAKDPCVRVEVGKRGDPPQTIVIAHGYNTCSTGILRLERVLQVSY